VNTFVLAPTTLPEVTPLEYIDAAIHAGYDAVGLRLHKSPGLPFHPIVGNAALIAEIKAMLKANSMPVFDTFSCYLEPATKMSDFTASLALAAELDGKYIMVMGNDTDYARMSDNFGLFCDEAARFNLMPTIEFVPTRPLCTMAMAIKMIKESGRGTVCLDPMHFVRTGGTGAEIKSYGAKYFPYTQINDGVLFPGEPNPEDFGKMRQGQRKMLGEGDVPLYEYLDALPAGLPLSVEIPIELGAGLRDVKAKPYTPREWAMVALKNSRDFMSGYYAARPARA
jgi:sugar phosphate isomerase/epimerase